MTPSSTFVDIIMIANRICQRERYRKSYLAGKLAWSELPAEVQQALRDESHASWDEFEAHNRALPADRQRD